MRAIDTPPNAHGAPGYHRIDFDSWGDFATYADQRPALRGRRFASRDGDMEFCGSRSWDATMKLARDGWPEGEKHTKSISSSIFDFVSSQIERPHWSYDVEGTEIDVARYLDGEPECWQRQETRITEGPGRRLVRIVFNASTSGGVDRHVMTARGAVVTALVELLDLAGYGVELVLACNEAAGADSFEMYVPIKAFDQPLDLPRVAFALAHPSTFRRMIFSVMEALPEWAYLAITRHAYGMPTDTRERGDIYVGRAMYGERHWTDPSGAREWVMSHLRGQGVTLKESAA